MVKQIRFDKRVVVITGAGSGLGRAYALEFAKRGAKIVVNDLGCTLSGEGQSKMPADNVVSEIKANGGIAIANYDSAEHGHLIIKTAIDNFGRVDVLINNAGIIRDNNMSEITERDWDLVLKFHLKSTFSVIRAAWTYMKNQRYGRIINTTSIAGIYGNINQANYSSAKMGIYGLTNALSKEGEKYNIRCNTIAPLNISRIISSLVQKEILEFISPDKIVPVVVFLAHDTCYENGSLIEACGGWVTKLRWQRGKGTFFTKPFGPEDIEKQISEINNFENCDYPKSSTDIMQKVLVLMEEANYPKPRL